MLCWVSSAQRGEANFSWTVLTQLAFRMYNFVLESKRGGLTVANQRLATATKGKKYFKEEFEKFFPPDSDGAQELVSPRLTKCLRSLSFILSELEVIQRILYHYF